MANNALIPLLVTMMLVTGVCNTILNKYQVRPRFRATKKHELIAAPRTGYAMRAELRFPRSQPAEAVRAAGHSNVGFTSC